MSSILIGVGWFGIVLGIAYYFVDKQMHGKLELESFVGIKTVLISSIAMIVVGYLIRYLPAKLGIGYARCKKCNKVIDKGEMFCFDHRIEVIRQAQDKGRTITTQVKK